MMNQLDVWSRLSVTLPGGHLRPPQTHTCRLPCGHLQPLQSHVETGPHWRDSPLTDPCQHTEHRHLSSRPSVAPSTGQQYDVTRFNCNRSSQKQALGHNHDSRTRHRLDVLTCTPMTPWHILSRRMIFMRLPAPHLGTTSPINDHPHPPPCRRQRHVASSMLLHWTIFTRRISHDGVLAVSTRSPHRPTVARPEALVGRLPGASVASNPWPRSDTNCWNSPTDQSHKAIQTYTETKFIVKRAYRTL
jgi:hypothetical protein